MDGHLNILWGEVSGGVFENVFFFGEHQSDMFLVVVIYCSKRLKVRS